MSRIVLLWCLNIIWPCYGLVLFKMLLITFAFQVAFSNRCSNEHCVTRGVATIEATEAAASPKKIFSTKLS